MANDVCVVLIWFGLPSCNEPSAGAGRRWTDVGGAGLALCRSRLGVRSYCPRKIGKHLETNRQSTQRLRQNLTHHSARRGSAINLDTEVVTKRGGCKALNARLAILSHQPHLGRIVVHGWRSARFTAVHSDIVLKRETIQQRRAKIISRAAAPPFTPSCFHWLALSALNSTNLCAVLKVTRTNFSCTLGLKGAAHRYFVTRVSFRRLQLEVYSFVTGVLAVVSALCTSSFPAHMPAAGRLKYSVLVDGPP